MAWSREGANKRGGGKGGSRQICDRKVGKEPPSLGGDMLPQPASNWVGTGSFSGGRESFRLGETRI